ncbi:hypothetical protein Gpo141_00014300 [Globisporangium polare]
MLKSLLAVLLVVSASSGAVRALAPCGQGQSEMSVEGAVGIFCVDGTRICIADVSDGVCPPKQEGLPFGSYCGLVATKVYGCKTLTAQSTPTPTTAIPTPTPTTATPTPVPTTAAPTVTPTPTSATPSVSTPAPTTKTPSPASGVVATTTSINCPNGGAEMSVEGVQGIFCVKGGPLCSADIKSGLCPGVETPRLPLGSYCGVVASGVYGCKVGTTTPGTGATGGGAASTTGSTSASISSSASTTASGSSTTTTTTTGGGSTITTTGGSSTTVGALAPVTSSTNCPNGGAEMSVEGVQGVFCVKGGPLCSGDVKSGLCPGIENPRLPLGSYCGVVASGVYGCKVAVGGTAAVVPTPAAPQGASSAPSSATATPSSSTGGAAASFAPVAPGSNCPAGESEVSVEGVKGFFCIAGGPICSGSISTGLCPGKSDRLPIGAYCGVVASGVYGCKISNSQSVTTSTPAVTPEPTTKAPSPSSATPTTSTPTPSSSIANTTASASASASADCPNGGTPMSIVGCAKIFCVTGDACVGERSTGNCPAADAAMGLPKGSFCDIVRLGVYGCKPIV